MNSSKKPRAGAVGGRLPHPGAPGTPGVCLGCRARPLWGRIAGLDFWVPEQVQ